MYRSVGKLLLSVTITRRAGDLVACTRSAALSTLNRLIEVVSVTTTSPARAPINPARRLPKRSDKSRQPAVFQLRIRPLPHSWAITS
ncbi:hypothetical protein D9M71_837170 [compost metagenome]